MIDTYVYSTPARESPIATAALASLLEQVSHTPDGANIYVQDSQDFCEANAILHIAEDCETLAIAGFAATKIKKDQAELFSVTVPQPYRGHGIGGQVVDQAIEDCRDRGCTSIVLDIRMTDAGLPIPALRIYQSRGFVLLPGVTVVPIGHTRQDRHQWIHADLDGVFRKRHMSLALNAKAAERTNG